MDALVVYEYGPFDLTPRLTTPTLAQVQALEAALAPLEQVEVPVEHYFSPGQYTRKCTIPAGTVAVGKMHRHQHPTFLLSGTVRINTDRGMEEITGPHIWISQVDAKRALYAVTDCVFATVHLNPNDTQDLEAIEADVIVPAGLLEAAQEARFLTDAVQGVYE